MVEFFFVFLFERNFEKLVKINNTYVQVNNFEHNP